MFVTDDRSALNEAPYLVTCSLTVRTAASDLYDSSQAKRAQG